MSWKTIIDSLIQLPMMDDVVGKSRHEQTLKDVLEAEPAIYWYPGSGDDLASLVLDMPQNPTGRRLFPQRGDRQGKPLLLWMNDYLDCFAGFPSRGRDNGNEFDFNLGGVQATVTIEGSPGRFVFPATGTSGGKQRATAVPLTIFQGRVKSKPPEKGAPARYERHMEGDLYTVFYSAAESENLLRLVFVPHCIRIEVVALQKQGGTSCQRAHFDPESKFEQYEGIPRLLEEFKPQVGQVQAYLIDHDEKIPNYERLPHPKQPAWGHGGTRMWIPLKRQDLPPQAPEPPEPSALAQVILDTLEWKRKQEGKPPHFLTVIQGRGCHEEDGTIFTDLRQEEEDVLWRHIRKRLKVKVLDHGCGMGRHSAFIRRKRPDAELWGTETDETLLALCQREFQPPQFCRSLDEVSQHGYDLALLLGNNVGIFGLENDTRAGLERLFEMLYPGGVLIGECCPLSGRPYSCERLEVQYRGRAVQYQWGFMDWSWIQTCLVDIGFLVEPPVASRGGMAWMFVARKP